MRFIKLIPLVGIFISCCASAGFKELTIHSRANCGNNESISWHFNHSHNLLTVSEHLRYGQMQHRLTSGWKVTWRSANVHWGEAGPNAGWHVQAGHYIRIGNKEFRIGFTEADNCNIYDGWWDV